MSENENYVNVTQLMRRWHCSRPTAMRYLRRYNAQIIQFGGGRVLVPEGEVARIEALAASGGRITSVTSVK